MRVHGADKVGQDLLSGQTEQVAKVEAMLPLEDVLEAFPRQDADQLGVELGEGQRMRNPSDEYRGSSKVIRGW